MPQATYPVPVSSLEFSVMLSNQLKKLGIDYLSELAPKSDLELKDLKFRRRDIKQIREALSIYPDGVHHPPQGYTPSVQPPEPSWHKGAFSFLYVLLGSAPCVASDILVANPDKRNALHRLIYENSPHEEPYDAMMKRLLPDGLPAPVPYVVGKNTLTKVFRPKGIVNLSDMQGLLDAVEEALAPRQAVLDFDVEEYVDGYTFEGDGGGYTPTEDERALITDAIQGVLSELCIAPHKEATAAAAGEVALADLVSWFTKPVQGQNGMVWVIPAGAQGADDAINASRAALQARKEDGPKPQYRLLKQGEIMLADDELLRDDCVTWSPCREAAPISVGMAYSEKVMVPIRRKVSQDQ